MSERPVAIRGAAAGDEAAAAWALDTATDGLFGHLLGRRVGELLAEVVAVPGHAWSLDNVRLAHDADQVLGVAISGPASQPGADPVLWDVLRSRSWLVALRAAGFSLAAHPVFSFMGRHGPGEWYLTAIAVHESARGHGVGGRLIDDCMRLATDGGLAAVTLDVDASNVAAQRLYARLGFSTIAVSRRALLLGGTRVERMLRSTTTPPTP